MLPCPICQRNVLSRRKQVGYRPRQPPRPGWSRIRSGSGISSGSRRCFLSRSGSSVSLRKKKIENVSRKDRDIRHKYDRRFAVKSTIPSASPSWDPVHRLVCRPISSGVLPLPHTRSKALSMKMAVGHRSGILFARFPARSRVADRGRSPATRITEPTRTLRY